MALYNNDYNNEIYDAPVGRASTITARPSIPDPSLLDDMVPANASANNRDTSPDGLSPKNERPGSVALLQLSDHGHEQLGQPSTGLTAINPRKDQSA